jgi:non-heme chloroperoxidase
VPFAHAIALTAKIVPNSIVKGYVGAPHGLASTHQDQLNQDLLYFAQ